MAFAGALLGLAGLLGGDRRATIVLVVAAIVLALAVTLGPSAP